MPPRAYVSEFIERNVTCFERSGISFRHLDILRSPLPDGDLLLYKDVLQHWPIVDMLDFAKRVLRNCECVLLMNRIQAAKRGLNSLNSKFISTGPVHWTWRSHRSTLRQPGVKTILLFAERGNEFFFSQPEKAVSFRDADISCGASV